MRKFVLLFAFVSFSICLVAQEQEQTKTDTTVQYRIVKSDGGELIGVILKQDEREVYFKTADNRRIYIPQHVIAKIEKLKGSDFNEKGVFIGDDAFATRYFLTTNGLPIKKGENYVQLNLYGPDFQFAISDNLSIGVASTWIGMPVMGSIKRSWKLNDKTHVAAGGLVLTGSWAAPDFFGAVPFGSITRGDRQKNITLSAGYGTILSDGVADGRAIASLAGMIKVSNKISLVFDSFILMHANEETGPGFAFFVPGIRWHQSQGKAFQFGFLGAVDEGELFPLPIPMIQWYRKL